MALLTKFVALPALLTAFAISILNAEASEKRAIYIIGHRANDITDIKEVFAAKANGIEIDVRWGNHLFGDDRWYVDHDGIFPWSTKLDSWLEELVNQLDHFDQQAAMIIFDVKTPNHIAKLIPLIHSFLPTDLQIVISTGNIADIEHFKPVLAELRDNESVAIDYAADPQETVDFFHRQQFYRVWYGDGICAFCPEPRRVERHLLKASLMKKQRKSKSGIKSKRFFIICWKILMV